MRASPCRKGVAIALLNLLLSGACVAAGVMTAKQSLRRAAVAGGIGLVLVLAHFALAHVTGIEARFITWEAYPFVERWWFHLPVFFTIGAGLYAARASVILRCTLLVFTGLFLMRAAEGMRADAFRRPLTGQVARDGLCRQSTDYSCGAAAAATFLHHLGVETTEDEMGRLCATRRGLAGGTTEAGVLRGLRRKGLRVEVVRELRAPSMAPIRLNALVAHWVVVTDATPTRVRIADPRGHWVGMSREIFNHMWLGSCVAVR